MCTEAGFKFHEWAIVDIECDHLMCNVTIAIWAKGMLGVPPLAPDGETLAICSRLIACDHLMYNLSLFLSLSVEIECDHLMCTKAGFKIRNCIEWAVVEIDCDHLINKGVGFQDSWVSYCRNRMRPSDVYRSGFQVSWVSHCRYRMRPSDVQCYNCNLSKGNAGGTALGTRRGNSRNFSSNWSHATIW